MRMRQGPIAVLFLTFFAACESGLGPSTEADGLRFTASVVQIPSFDEVVLRFSISARNETIFPIRRTLLGGCLIERIRLFRGTPGGRVVLWDTAERLDLRACASDLVELDLAAGGVASPDAWARDGRPGEGGIEVPAGTYTAELSLRVGANLRVLEVDRIRIS